MYPFPKLLGEGYLLGGGRRSPVAEVSNLRPQSTTLGKLVESIPKARLNLLI